MTYAKVSVVCERAIGCWIIANRLCNATNTNASEISRDLRSMGYCLTCIAKRYKKKCKRHADCRTTSAPVTNASIDIWAFQKGTTVVRQRKGIPKMSPFNAPFNARKGQHRVTIRWYIFTREGSRVEQEDLQI